MEKKHWLIAILLIGTAFCSLNASANMTKQLDNEAPTVEIHNPSEGYFHFSGIKLFPTIMNIFGDTMGFGGFRLRPIQINASDNIDEKTDLSVSVYIDDEELGDAEYNEESGFHEIKWTGPDLGMRELKVVVEDTSENTAEVKMDVWYFCFIP